MLKRSLSRGSKRSVLATVKVQTTPAQNWTTIQQIKNLATSFLVQGNMNIDMRHNKFFSFHDYVMPGAIHCSDRKIPL